MNLVELRVIQFGIWRAWRAGCMEGLLEDKGKLGGASRDAGQGPGAQCHEVSVPIMIGVAARSLSKHNARPCGPFPKHNGVTGSFVENWRVFGELSDRETFMAVV